MHIVGVKICSDAKRKECEEQQGGGILSRNEN